MLARADEITPEDLLLEPATEVRAELAEGGLQETIDRAAAARVESALRAAGGNRAEAARTLGIDRTTLYRWLRRLGRPER